MIPEIGNFFLVFSMINSLLLVATAFVLPSVSERFFYWLVWYLFLDYY